MAKINYQLQAEAVIEKLDKDASKPTLFLHACCGPCLVYPLEYLAAHFKITIGFSNSNIYPVTEYTKRLFELLRYVKIFNEKHKADIKVEIFDYDHDKKFLSQIRGLENLEEGGARCHMCYFLRLHEAYEYANAEHYDYFTTVMTVSSFKDSQVFNEIGEYLSKKFTIKYFFSDFKKNNGMNKGIKISASANLYRQEYCGCEFSATYKKGD